MSDDRRGAMRDAQWAARVGEQAQRLQRWLHGDSPSLMRQLAAVGVLGWIVVVPALLGVALGRWLDRTFDTGIFWSAPLLVVGLALGCWSGWRWMHER